LTSRSMDSRTTFTSWWLAPLRVLTIYTVLAILTKTSRMRTFL